MFNTCPWRTTRCVECVLTQYSDVNRSTLTQFKYNLYCVCLHSDCTAVREPVFIQLYFSLTRLRRSPAGNFWVFLLTELNSERQTLTAMRCVVLCRVANRKCRCAAGSRNSSSVVDASPPTVKCCSSVALIYCSGLFVVGGASSRPVMEWQLLLRCSLHCICMHCLYFPLQCF